jgi:hypothetical protein
MRAHIPKTRAVAGPLHPSAPEFRSRWCATARKFLGSGGVSKIPYERAQRRLQLSAAQRRMRLTQDAVGPVRATKTPGLRRSLGRRVVKPAPRYGLRPFRRPSREPRPRPVAQFGAGAPASERGDGRRGRRIAGKFAVPSAAMLGGEARTARRRAGRNDLPARTSACPCAVRCVVACRPRANRARGQAR